MVEESNGKEEWGDQGRSFAKDGFSSWYGRDVRFSFDD